MRGSDKTASRTFSYVGGGQTSPYPQGYGPRSARTSRSILVRVLKISGNKSTRGNETIFALLSVGESRFIGSARKSFLPTYAGLMASTWQERQGLEPNAPSKLYASIFKQREVLKLKVMAATYQRRVIAAIWLLFRNDQCCYWDGASDQPYRRLNATHLLQWEAFRWCLKNDFKVYDMGGGATTGREGLVRFKRSLGARPVEYSNLYWQTNTMRLALAGYRWAARLRNRLKRRDGPIPGVEMTPKFVTRDEAEQS